MVARRRLEADQHQLAHRIRDIRGQRIANNREARYEISTDVAHSYRVVHNEKAVRCVVRMKREAKLIQRFVLTRAIRDIQKRVREQHAILHDENRAPPLHDEQSLGVPLRRREHQRLIQSVHNGFKRQLS